TDPVAGRKAALKLLPLRFTGDAERLKRFEQEARAVVGLNHPNIVTVYEIGEEKSIHYIASELIEGETLRDSLTRGSLQLSEALDVAIQIASALIAAHRAGIVHRDIKPENIMIRPDGLVKVLDFGLARTTHASHTRRPVATESGAITGTPRYMSPEQARGEKLDSRTDIFSLGAVLYEMTHGRPAFPGVTIAEVFANLLKSDAVVDSGTGFDAILQKALQKDRETRYGSIDELEKDLRKFELRRGLRPKVSWGIAAVFLAVVLAAAATLYLFSHKPPLLSDRDTILLADFVNQTGDPVFDLTLEQGLAVQLEQSPRLDIFSEEGLRETLRLMRQPPDKPITAEIAREVCERQGLKAYVMGTIAPIGSHYAITLTAVDIQSGGTLVRVQAEAAAKEQVLRAL